MWSLTLLLLLPALAARGQRLADRGCGIRLVVDPLLWRYFKSLVTWEKEEEEVARVARYTLTNMVSRLVNQANDVLGKYSFQGRKYKLLLKDIQVTISYDDKRDSYISFLSDPVR